MSAQDKETYQPSASRETVTVLLVPTTGRLQRTALRPSLASTRYPFQCPARPVAILLRGQEVRAIAPLKPRKAWFLARLHAAKERLIGRVQPSEHVLEHLGMDGSRVRGGGA